MFPASGSREKGLQECPTVAELTAPLLPFETAASPTLSQLIAQQALNTGSTEPSSGSDFFFPWIWAVILLLQPSLRLLDHSRLRPL